ncbi:MAG: serine/threonine protein kinase [Planctomycetota bacterium]|nr:MAG: serine/threonine protein kinase [Planctomycetota bacterium]
MSSVDSSNASRQGEMTPGSGITAPGGQPTVLRRQTPAAELPPGTPRLDPELVRRLFPGPGDPDVDPAGVRLGHFTIEARIGRGGMGAVFRARDERLKRTVALKLLAPEQSRDAAAVARFLNEAQAAARLNHENIARVFYSGEDHGLHFIAFEFVEGVNLLELLRQRGVLSPPEAIRYMLQIAHALAHASRYGVVHRDIKPSNIIVTRTGSAKLVDLGLARKQSLETSEAELTVAGTTLGTFDYLAPEQAQDPRNVDVRSDIYSLGCTLYHLLTGSPPYPDGTLLQKVLAHREGTPPDVRERNPQVTPELAAVVRKMMANRPEDRYQTAEELIVDLQRVARQYGILNGSATGMPAAPPFRSQIRTHLGWLLAGALILIAAVGAEWAGTSGWLRVEPGDVGGGVAPPGRLGEFPRVPAGNAVSGTPVGPAEGLGGAAVVSSGESGRGDASPIVPTDRHDLATQAAESAGTRPATGGSGAETVADAGAERSGSEKGGHSAAPNASDASAVAGGGKGSNGAGTRSTVTESVQPASSSAAVATGEKRAVFRVLPAETREAEEFRTLEAALAAVPDGGTIECRFDGVRSETPVVVHGKNVVIRGGMGFRPVLEFAPPVGADWSREMLRINGGSLTLVGLHVRFRSAPGGSGGDHALFAMNSAQGLRLRDTVVTVSGGAAETAVVRCTHEPQPRRPDMKMMKKASDAPMVPEVELSNVVVRGDGDLFVVAQSTPLRLIVSGTLVATTGDVVRVTGDFMPPSEGGTLECRFDYSTFVTRGALLELDAGGVQRTLPQVAAAVRSCVVATVDAPMILMQGGDDSEGLRGLLRWNGERNVYDGIRVFWRFGKSASEQVTAYEEWEALWGAYEVGGQSVRLHWPVDWRRVADWSTLTPDAFVQGLENGAASSATNAAAPMAGADAARLQDLFHDVAARPEP